MRNYIFNAQGNACKVIHDFLAMQREVLKDFLDEKM